MSKKLFIILGFVLSLLFIISVISIAQEDVPESKIIPLLPECQIFTLLIITKRNLTRWTLKTVKGKM